MNKNKTIKLAFVITVLILFLFIFFRYKVFNNKDESLLIPDNYIAVFHGGSSELTYETYLYKIENGIDHHGFKYINVLCTTKKWGSKEVIRRITEKGKIDDMDEIIMVSKKNHADSYVTTPFSDKIFTILEYQELFILNK